MHRYEVRIGADDSVDGLHVMKLKAGNGRGELHAFRLRPGPGEHECFIEFRDRNGDVVRVKRLWLEKRIVA